MSKARSYHGFLYQTLTDPDSPYLAIHADGGPCIGFVLDRGIDPTAQHRWRALWHNTCLGDFPSRAGAIHAIIDNYRR
jgi:hypothetical protein